MNALVYSWVYFGCLQPSPTLFLRTRTSRFSLNIFTSQDPWKNPEYFVAYHVSYNFNQVNYCVSPYFGYLLDHNYLSHSAFIALDHLPHVYPPEAGTGQINITSEDAVMDGLDPKEITPLDSGDLSNTEKSLGRYTLLLYFNFSPS